MKMKPVIKTLSARTVVGMEARFFSIRSKQANAFEVIPPLWGRYSARSGEIAARADKGHMGVMISPGEGARDGEMIYIAGAAVTDAKKVPSGMRSISVPAGNYAVFTHKGPISKLGPTIEYIYGTWLPEAGASVRTAPHLEIYDERFSPDGADSEFEICVPVS